MGKKNKKNKEILPAPSRRIIYEEGYVDGTKTVLYRYDGKLRMAGSVKMKNGQLCEFESLPIEFMHNLIEKHYQEQQEKYLHSVNSGNLNFFYEDNTDDLLDTVKDDEKKSNIVKENNTGTDDDDIFD